MQLSLARFILFYSPLLFSTTCSLQVHATQQTSLALNANTAIPIADFFNKPAFSGPVWSPDGRHLAMQASQQGGQSQVYTLDLPDMQLHRLTSLEDTDIATIAWVNDKRLVYSTMQRGIAHSEMRYGPGLYAINIDGSDYRQLASYNDARNSSTGTHIKQSMLGRNTQLFKTSSARNSDEIFVTESSFNDKGKPSSILLRLNTMTGASRPAATLGNVQEWIVDGNDEVRIAISNGDTRETIYYRENADMPWRKLHESDLYQAVKGDFIPAFFDAKGNFYVRSGYHGMKALYQYALQSATMKDLPLVDTPGYDFDGQPVQNHQKLLGVRYETDAGGSVWFDRHMRDVQAKVDALLPDTVNQLSVPARAETPFVLVQASSDIEPGKALIYNMDNGSLLPFSSAQPAIDSARMSPKIMLRYQARDGLEIPAYLTLPKNHGDKHLPMVIMVHGGPWLRGGHWNWNRETQFLASRGYAVLEPDYRGSTGYGVAHYKAGWKQWGLKMQDDIADGARWAIAQGYADPQRICIAGASYGGYATLMGLLNDPALFKCGISWAAVTDINRMRDGQWTGGSDLSDMFKRYGMKELVGDPITDAAQLQATSPLAQAARIKQPLLLAYGGADQRVPINQGLTFLDAVQKGNSHVEWVEYQEEGHGWALPKNNIDFWGRVEKFLDTHIGNGVRR